MDAERPHHLPKVMAIVKIVLSKGSYWTATWHLETPNTNLYLPPIMGAPACQKKISPAGTRTPDNGVSIRIKAGRTQSQCAFGLYKHRVINHLDDGRRKSTGNFILPICGRRKSRHRPSPSQNIMPIYQTRAPKFGAGQRVCLGKRSHT